MVITKRNQNQQMKRPLKKEDKQELKRKCLEGEVTELKKIPNDSSNNKEEEKNRTTLPDDSPPQYKNPIELKPRRVARPTPMLSPIIPKKETDVKNSKSASSIAQPREEPVQKPVKVLKINHKEILAPRATFPTMKKASMGYRMIKEPNPVQPTMTSPSDCTTSAVLRSQLNTRTENTNKYDSSMYNSGQNADDQQAPYSRIFPSGMEPPILDQRHKRDRRLSSIVGIKSIGYGCDNEVEELLENRSINSYQQDNNRKPSIDFFKLQTDKKD